MTVKEIESNLNKNQMLFEYLRFIIDNTEYTGVALERLSKECKIIT